MATFYLPGIPFTVFFMAIMIGLWRRRWFDYTLVGQGVSVFFKLSAMFSSFVYLGMAVFVFFMWSTLGWWSVLIALQSYLILALCGFIFTGKIY